MSNDKAIKLLKKSFTYVGGTYVAQIDSRVYDEIIKLLESEPDIGMLDVWVERAMKAESELGLLKMGFKPVESRPESVNFYQELRCEKCGNTASEMVQTGWPSWTCRNCVEKQQAESKPSDEKERRIYYQDLVYFICRQIDKIAGGTTICGTVDNPNVEEFKARFNAVLFGSLAEKSKPEQGEFTKEITDVALKPCPFCGGRVRIVKSQIQGEIDRLEAENKDLRQNSEEYRKNSVYLTDRIEILKAELKKSQAQSKKGICAYCGMIWEDRAEKSDEITAHIVSCEKNPLNNLIEQLQAELKAKEEK